jgi:hypothetical protein
MVCDFLSFNFGFPSYSRRLQNSGTGSTYLQFLSIHQLYVFLCPLFSLSCVTMKFLRYFFGLNFNRSCLQVLRCPSNGCSAISAAKSPKSSTSSAVSSHLQYYFPFRLVPLTLLVLVKVLLQQRFF